MEWGLVPGAHEGKTKEANAAIAAGWPHSAACPCEVGRVPSRSFDGKGGPGAMVRKGEREREQEGD